MGKKIIIFLASLLFALHTKPVRATVNPLSFPNNKFGIHVIDENDLEDAAKLVNSSGGQWGYITIVIPQNDRNHNKWQRTFDRMRRLKLIPLIRLATYAKDNGWAKPTIDQADDWADFLNSLKWVTQNRYIILFNEPNRAKEWGGDVNPAEYTRIAQVYRDKLKEASADFFILPAGFDAAAPDSNESMKATRYFSLMQAENNNIFKIFDGWTSHSYPGKPGLTGYLTEINFLQRYGLPRNLPVFITETGWTNTNNTSVQKNAQNIKAAFSSVWTDPRIVAVTPFLLSYLTAPFDIFSWKIPGTANFYPQYFAVQNLVKTAGKPRQIENSNYLAGLIPEELITDSEYQLAIKFKNSGQSIWTEEDYSLIIESDFPAESLFVGKISTTEPNELAQINLNLKTPKQKSEKNLSFQLSKNAEPFGEKANLKIKIIPPPGLTFKTKLWGNRNVPSDDYSLLFAQDKTPVKEIKNISTVNGTGTIAEIHDVVPGKKYELRLKKPGYLTKKRVITLAKETTKVNFGFLFPFDVNSDGKFGLIDFLLGGVHPLKVLKI